MELLDVYNADHEPVGRTIPRDGTVAEGERLLVVHVCVLNRKGEMLIQKRQTSKDRYPGCWDLSAGGFVLSGEDSCGAVLRELREEMGISLCPADISYLFTWPISYVLDDFYLARSDLSLSNLILQQEEVSEAAWASQAEIEAMIADGSFVDYPPDCIRKVFRLSAEMK